MGLNQRHLLLRGGGPDHPLHGRAEIFDRLEWTIFPRAFRDPCRMLIRPADLGHKSRSVHCVQLCQRQTLKAHTDNPRLDRRLLFCRYAEVALDVGNSLGVWLMFVSGRLPAEGASLPGGSAFARTAAVA